jgi:hypothetical protein
VRYYSQAWNVAKVRAIVCHQRQALPLGNCGNPAVSAGNRLPDVSAVRRYFRPTICNSRIVGHNDVVPQDFLKLFNPAHAPMPLDCPQFEFSVALD